MLFLFVLELQKRMQPKPHPSQMVFTFATICAEVILADSVLLTSTKTAAKQTIAKFFSQKNPPKSSLKV
jgi:hypothetical protein